MLIFYPTHPSEMHTSLLDICQNGFTSWRFFKFASLGHWSKNYSCNLWIQPLGGRTVSKLPGPDSPWIPLNSVRCLNAWAPPGPSLQDQPAASAWALAGTQDLCGQSALWSGKSLRERHCVTIQQCVLCKCWGPSVFVRAGDLKLCSAHRSSHHLEFSLHSREFCLDESPDS